VSCTTSFPIINGENITREDKSLLNTVPRLRFVVENHMTLKEAVQQLQQKNKASDYTKAKFEDNEKITKKEKLTHDNGYGGF
jgi:hypothetical protein